MMMNFMLCLGAIVAICLLFLHRVSVVILTAMLIAMIDIDLVGSIQCVHTHARAHTQTHIQQTHTHTQTHAHTHIHTHTDVSCPGHSMWGLEVNSISVINMIMAVGFVQTLSLFCNLNPHTKLRKSLW